MAILVVSTNGKTISKPTLHAALTDADTLGKTIVITGPVNINSAEVVTGRKFKIENNGVITYSGAGSLTFSTGVVDYVDPLWFGAVGDGDYSTGAGTDSTQAFQHAIDAAGSLFPVRIPPGSYKITDTLNIYQGTQLIGSHAVPFDPVSKTYSGVNYGCQLMLVTTEAIPLISLGPDSPATGAGYTWNVRVSNLDMFAFNDTVGTTGLLLKNPASSIFENIGINGYFGVGIDIWHGMRCVYTNINTLSCKEAGLKISDEGTTTTQTFNTCTFRGSPWAVILEGSASGYSIWSEFNSCLIESCTLGGMNIHQGCGATINGMYTEAVPVTGTGPIFRVGYDGDANGGNSHFILTNSIIRGTNSTPVTSTLIEIDTWYHAVITGCNFARGHNLITWTANTGLNSVYMFGNSWVTISHPLPSYDTLPNIFVGTWELAQYNAGITMNSTTNVQLLVATQLTVSNTSFKDVTSLIVVGTGTKIVIPVISQNHCNRKHIVEIIGMDGTDNTAVPYSFSAQFSFGSLSTLTNLTELGKYGTVSTIAVSGMDIVITLTHSVTNPILNLRITSSFFNSEDLFVLENITVE